MGLFQNFFVFLSGPTLILSAWVCSRTFFVFLSGPTLILSAWVYSRTYFFFVWPYLNIVSMGLFQNFFVSVFDITLYSSQLRHSMGEGCEVVTVKIQKHCTTNMKRCQEVLLTLNEPISTKVICFSHLLKYLRSLYGKSVDPDQTAPIGAVCSESMLFASILNSSVMLGSYLQQTPSADYILRCIFT